MRKTDLLCRASLIASAFVGFTATPAMAQDSDPTASADDDVIVVVARKREERVLDVPIAVTAVGEVQLAKMGANDLSGVQGAI
ncbi:MAG: TonB-dependent receptor, partial [Novosphingobium sp.]|nr:TonB-dependent receptor [Novosphingobium sp.]